MAVAAGVDCLRGQDRQAIDGLVFASTTPPYAEKQCAALIATALDLRRDIFSADVTDALRAGTTGLKSALDSVAAGSAEKVLVIASDNRPAAPRGDAEGKLGDGAAALLVSRGRGNRFFGRPLFDHRKHAGLVAFRRGPIRALLGGPFR